MIPFTRSLCIQLSWLTLFIGACTAAPGTAVMSPDPPPAKKTPQATAVPQSDIPIGDASLAFKQVIGAEAFWLMPVDPQTGAKVTGYEPIELGVTFSHRLSPDKRTLVFVSVPEGEQNGASLRFLDLATWTEARPLMLSALGWTSAMTISPDGSAVAFATTQQRQSSIWLVDLARHVLLNRVETPHPVVEMAFTGNSQGLMLYQRQENYETGLSEGPPIAELRSARNLAMVWSRILMDVRDGFQAYEGQTGQPHEPGTGSTYRPAVVFDAQAEAMFVLHADSDRLTRVDFRRHVTSTQDITPKLSWLERLLALGSMTAHAKAQDGIERHVAISPDGEVVYTAGLQTKLTKTSNGSWDLVQTHLPLQAIRLGDASELYRSEATGDTIEISADGRTILLGRWDITAGDEAGTAILDAATGEIQNEVAGFQLRHSARLDGSPLLVGTSYAGGGRSRSTLAAYGPDLQLIGTWQSLGYGDWIALR